MLEAASKPGSRAAGEPAGDARPEAELRLIERGELAFYVRPRVQLETARSFADVQKLVMLLSPEASSREPTGGDEVSALARSIHVGRKRMPDGLVREREWAYVDRVGEAEAIDADLTTPRTYTTKTRGIRRQSGARVVASGAYGIVTHGTHVHLVTSLTDYADDAMPGLLDGLRLVPRGSYIAAVFNPEAKWRIRDGEGPEVPFGEPSIFEDEVMERFGKRRFAPLAPELVDQVGAELVLIGGCSAEAIAGVLRAP